MLRAERVTGSVTHHGEGPLWDDQHRRLLCVDVMAGAVVALDECGTSRYQSPGSVVTAIRKRSAGGFVVSTDHEVAVTDDEFSDFRPIVQLTADANVRANDGGCDPFGNFIVGTMTYDERADGGTVYRVNPEYEVEQLLSPVSISNGVQWSSDGTRAFYIDSPTRRVDVFDVDPETGRWSNRRIHVLTDGDGVPDGMAIDEEGGLWVAMWGGGVVNHYDVNGTFIEAVSVPGVTQVSSCTFGGDARSVLYITTSRLGLDENEQTLAGSIFAVQTHSRGADLWEFAG